MMQPSGNMTAIVHDAPGGPEVLQPKSMPIPAPGRGEVLVAVAFAGVNRPDVIQRQGLYPPPPGASPLLGLEVAGRIAAVGEGVDAARIGETVCALTPGGGYAEYCTVPAGHCLPVPGGMDLAAAAAVPETLFTVWHNVFQRGRATAGERLLVHGGTSGIGTMAIQLAKARGLAVAATAGSAAKCAAIRDLGADLAVNYRDEDFVAAIGEWTGGAGVDVVLDMVSGDYVPRNLACLAEDGRHVTIAVLGGVKAEINMALVMRRRLTLTGSTLRPRSDAFKTALAEDLRGEVWPLFADGTLAPVMDTIFPLAEAAAAHRRMEAGDHVGKIVLRVGQ